MAIISRNNALQIYVSFVFYFFFFVVNFELLIFFANLSNKKKLHLERRKKNAKIYFAISL